MVSTYFPRLLDRELADDLLGLPAIHLAGAKATGKTETARRQAGSIVRVDDAATRARIEADPSFIARQARPVLIDEWQRFPPTWDVIRRDVDEDNSPGRFILTGSAHPRGAHIHSGAGRITTLRMRPMSLAERGRAMVTVSLDRLLGGAGQDRASIEGVSDLSLEGYVDEIMSSGFPGVRAIPAKWRRNQLESYVDDVIQREFPEQGHTLRAPETLRRWLHAYAAATATTATYSKILDAATPGESDKPARKTTIAYRDVLQSLWLLDTVPAWWPEPDTLSLLGQAPKHFLADPALAAVLLEVDADDVLEGRVDRDPAVQVVAGGSGTVLGRLFEHLTALSLQCYSQSVGARLSHLRTRDGAHEVDFIVQRKRRLVGFEVKLSPVVKDEDVRHLFWLRDRLGPRVSDLVVVTTGAEAYRRADGIAVVPAALLGP